MVWYQNKRTIYQRLSGHLKYLCVQRKQVSTQSFFFFNDEMIIFLLMFVSVHLSVRLSLSLFVPRRFGENLKFSWLKINAKPHLLWSILYSIGELILLTIKSTSYNFLNTRCEIILQYFMGLTHTHNCISLWQLFF